MAAGVKTGGRTKGTPNKATAAKENAIAASGLTPLDFMLTVLRDPLQPYDARIDAAKAAAPYCHPRLVAVESKNETNINLTGAGPLKLECRRES